MPLRSGATLYQTHIYKNIMKSSLLRCFQLRYLQTLNNISAENNSTIVFPVPVDILSQLVLPQHQVRLHDGGGDDVVDVDLMLIWILLMQIMNNSTIIFPVPVDIHSQLVLPQHRVRLDF